MTNPLQGVAMLEDLEPASKYVLYEAARMALVDADNFDRICELTGFDQEKLGSLRDGLSLCLPPLEDAELETV